MKVWFLLFLFSISSLGAACTGNFPNVITDICWECIFPIRVGGSKITTGDDSGGDDRQIVCVCQKPPLNQPTPGIRISFWEPVRMMDVTRHPYCLVNLGGICLGKSSSVKDRGTVS